MRIDSSGRLLVGTSSAAGNHLLQIVGVAGGSNNYAGISLRREYTPLSNLGDTSPIGIINYEYTGGGVGAQIGAYCDVNVGAALDDYPTRLVFSTTADGASSPTQRIRITASGDIGFGNMNYLFPEADDAFSIGLSGYRWSAIWAANGTIQTSDQRAKTEIADAQLGSDFIKSLRPVSYKWIEGGKVDTGERDEDNNYIYESVPGTRTHWGFIAQEVKEAVDDAGVDFGGWVLTDKNDPDSEQALRYDQFIAPLTKALQEALAKIETLEQRLSDAGIA